jgi:hypothetical protein
MARVQNLSSDILSFAADAFAIRNAVHDTYVRPGKS